MNTLAPAHPLAAAIPAALRGVRSRRLPLATATLASEAPAAQDASNRKGFFMVRAEAVGRLSRASGIAAKVALALLSHDLRGQGQVFPSYSRIYELTGLWRKAISRGLAELESIGLIRRERRFGRATLYDIRPLKHVKGFGEASSSKNGTGALDREGTSSGIGTTASSENGTPPVPESEPNQFRDRNGEEARREKQERISTPPPPASAPGGPPSAGGDGKKSTGPAILATPAPYANLSPDELRKGAEHQLRKFGLESRIDGILGPAKAREPGEEG